MDDRPDHRAGIVDGNPFVGPDGNFSAPQFSEALERGSSPGPLCVADVGNPHLRDTTGRLAGTQRRLDCGDRERIVGDRNGQLHARRHTDHVIRCHNFLGLFRRWPFIGALLAHVGHRHQRGELAGTSSTADANVESGSLPRRDRPLVLADIADHRSGHPPAQHRNEQHRQLARLILSLYGDRAEQVAGVLIDDFGSLQSLLRSSKAALARRIPGEPVLVELLAAIQPLIRHMLQSEMLEGPILPDTKAALDYLFVTLAHESTEQVHALFLNAKNRVLAQERIAKGSVTKVDLFPREIVRRALDLGATGLILAHNHPSGDPTPSRSDFQATRAVADAARLFEIILHDHFIVGRTGWRSLREEGYL